ncbi:hypothetical protein [Embleya sp. NPDC001921]
MKPLVVFADAQAAAATVLRDALAGRGEPYADDVAVGTRVPGDRSPETPHLPYVLVRVDGQTVEHLANARTTIRVTVWHAGPDEAHDLAQLCQGLLLVHSGPVIRGVQPLTGPMPATDPNSGVDLSTLTVRAHVRPTVLAP